MKVSAIEIQEAIEDWAKKNEAIDKFGDLLLRSDVKDVLKISQFIANRINSKDSEC